MPGEMKDPVMAHPGPGLKAVAHPIPKPASISPFRPEARSDSELRLPPMVVVDGNPEAEAIPKQLLSEGTEIPSEVREFCAQKEIDEELEQTIVLARRHFAMIGEPRFQLVDDPECGEHYVGIHIQAEGQPEDVFRQSESFLDSFLDQIEIAKQKHIALIFHPSSD